MTMQISRRALMAGAATSLVLAACGQKKQAVVPYEVEEVALSQIADDLAAKKTTAVAVTQAYIDRIKKYDGMLHSVIAIAPDAIAQAEASDKRRAAGKPLGALEGIPILLKDNIDAVGMPTTAGSFALEFNLPKQDAEVVRRIKAAGAIVLGKANLSQFAGWRPAETVLNSSTVGKDARNPYDLARSPGGSSSGGGASTAASLAAANIGSDTTGSIIGPSSFNGIVGMRPTIALVSRTGVVPLSETMDTTGPMARTVRDAAMLLTAMAGSDARDPYTKDSDANKKDYVAGLSTDALKGKRLGVVRDFGGYNDKTQPVFDAALEVMKAQGAELVEIPAGQFPDHRVEQLAIMSYDFHDNFADYMKNAPEAVKVRDVDALVAFNKSDPRESMYDSGLIEYAASRTQGRADPEYAQMRALVKQRTAVEGFDKVFKDFNVTAVVLPTRDVADEMKPNGEKQPNRIPKENAKAPGSGSSIAALAGYPNLNVPMGLVNGLPVGISLIGPAWSEGDLLAMGYAYEQASKMRVAPKAYKVAVSTEQQK
ncbi:MAG: amidase [Rhodospirillaceae bacterium]|nr:amidase [Rhodospirillaceae bacterium]